MIVIGFAIVMAAMFLYEWRRLTLREADKGEKLAFTVLMAVAFALGTAIMLNVPLPQPTKGLETILKPFMLPD